MSVEAAGRDILLGGLVVVGGLLLYPASVWAVEFLRWALACHPLF